MNFFVSLSWLLLLCLITLPISLDCEPVYREHKFRHSQGPLNTGALIENWVTHKCHWYLLTTSLYYIPGPVPFWYDLCCLACVFTVAVKVQWHDDIYSALWNNFDNGTALEFYFNATHLKSPILPHLISTLQLSFRRVNLKVHIRYFS